MAKRKATIEDAYTELPDLMAEEDDDGEELHFINLDDPDDLGAEDDDY